MRVFNKSICLSAMFTLLAFGLVPAIAAETVSADGDGAPRSVSNSLLPKAYCVDNDGDGWFVGFPTAAACAPSQPTTDCNDFNPSIYPGAPEVCNGLDDDCDGSIDEGLLTTYYNDSDGDGFGDAADPLTTCLPAPPGFVLDDTDCDDSDPAIFPGAFEACNGIDNNCDGTANNAGTRYVATTGSNGAGGGNDCLASGSPCLTIQHAVDVACPGDAVEVAAGTYGAGATVDKSLTLKGAKFGQDARTRSVASGESIVDTAGGGDGFTVVASDVTVDGFEIRNVGQGVVSLVPTSVANTVVLNNYIHDASINGINFTRSSSGTASRNRVETIAISGVTGGDEFLAGHADDLLSVVQVDHNLIVGARFGITGYLGNSIIELNEIRDYAGPAPAAGLSGQLHDTTVRQNRVSGYLFGAGLAFAPYSIPTARLVSNNVTAVNNSLAGNGVAVAVQQDVSANTLHVNFNNLSGSLSGPAAVFRSGAVGVLDLSSNWWGTATASGVATAAAVDADYTPWVVSPTDAGGDPTDGFQPDLTALAVDDDSPQTGAIARIQEAHDTLSAAGVIDVMAGTYTESAVVSRPFPIVLKGAQFGVDARTRVAVPETVLNDATPAGTLEVRSGGHTIDGFKITNTAKAIHVTMASGGLTVANNIVDTASVDGINLWRATTAFVEKNLVRNVGTSGITAGDDAGTPSTGDDIRTSATVSQNRLENCTYGIAGYHLGSIITANTVIGGAASTSCGICGQFDSVQVTANTVTGYVATTLGSVALGAYPNRANSQNNLITLNDIVGNAIGLGFDAVSAAGTVVTANNISGNGLGLGSLAAAPLDATCNWWGASNGPNPPGSGNPVFGNVTVAGWLLANDYNADLDGDGFTSCTQYAGLGDCDQSNPAIFPGAPEPCDGIDNNCDGIVDNSGTRFVQTTGADGTNDCLSAGSPCLTIQHAIGVACAGETVDIGPGTFAQSLSLNKRLTLDGAGAASTTVAASTPGSSAITVTASGLDASNRVVVKELRVTGATGGGDGIRIAAAGSHYTFADVTATGNANAGIQAGTTGTVTDVVVSGATLSNNGVYGLFVPSSVTLFDGLTVTGGTMDSNGENGLAAYGSNSATNVTNISVTGTSFSNNGQGGSAGRGGVSFWRYNGNASLHNVAIDAGSYGRIGLQLTGRSAPLAASGTVALNNVSLTGAHAYSGLSIQNYTNVAGISMADVVENTTGPFGFYLENLGSSLNLGNTKFKGALAAHGPNRTIANVSPGHVWAVDSFFDVFWDIDVNGASATNAQLWGIEDLIGHSVDAPGGGFVRVKAGHVHVTPNSVAPPVTTAPAVQRGVDAASAGETVWVQAGSYPNAVNLNKALTVLGEGPGSTVIDLSAQPSAGTVVTASGVTGNLTFNGFKLVTGPASTVNSNGIHLSNNSGGTVTLQNNEIWGNQAVGGTVKDNFGLIAGYGSTSALVFDGNTVRGGGDNPILLELYRGPVDFTNNTVYRGPQDAYTYDAIFVMNYGASNITTLQRFEGNLIDVGGGTVYTSATRTSGISIVAQFTGGAGPGGYTNVLIKDNLVVNLKPARRGIGLWDNSSGPGDIAAVIQGNTVTAAAGFTGEHGLRVLGGITGTVLSGNSVSGVIDGFQSRDWNGFPPTGTVLTGNSLSGNGVGLLMLAGTATASTNTISNNTAAGIRTQPGTTAAATRNHITGNAIGYDNLAVTSQTATCNWWGAATGPNTAGADTTAGPVDTTSWLLAADFGVDTDLDGFTSCTSDSGGDCLPTNSAVYPGAAQVCDGLNNDCSFPGWPTLVGTNEFDDDFDTYTECAGDCNDANAAINPGATELCNNIDDDCDTVVDGAAADPACDDSSVCTTDTCNAGGVCGYTSSGACDADGYVYYNKVAFGADALDLAKPVTNALVVMTGTASGSDYSFTDGQYVLPGAYGNVTLTPKKIVDGSLHPDDDWDRGLSSADASEIAKFVVTLVTFTPNQFKAGDVSANGLVTSFDASLVATKVVNEAFVLPVRTATGSDFGFDAVSVSYTPITGTSSTNFKAYLYGDVTMSWTSPPEIPQLAARAPEDPAFTISSNVPSTMVRSASTGEGAVLYLASGPAPTQDGRWQAVIGASNTDGILGLDLEITYDPATITMLDIQRLGLASEFGFEKSMKPGRSAVALYGVDPMRGTGNFLVLTFDVIGPLGGAPFTVSAEANEGQIPLTWSPGLPRGSRSPARTIDEE